MEEPTEPAAGTIEIDESKAGTGYLRDPSKNYASAQQNPIIPRDVVRKFALRGGESLEGRLSLSRSGPASLNAIDLICGLKPEAYRALKPFEDLAVVHPDQRIRFETPGGAPSMRIVDVLTPIGKGQRGLIVAPPRTGKTVLLKQMAEGIRTNHPEVFLMMLLIDERPEEVTEMRRMLCAPGKSWHHGAPEVVYSSNDSDTRSHGRIARLMFEKAKRHLELGEDVLILLDSLTRLGRAFNNLVGSSGRTMTGGLDIRALEIPKQLFGAARKIELGGSLTVIASVLVETGSRMDDFIFQEFKGTGNMEIVLSRDLANLRVWPAINLTESGTRKEELILGATSYDKMVRVRRRLLSMSPQRQIETMLADLAKWKTNEEYLANLA